MNIIVTGASRGIGYELVRNFSSRQGHNILAISRSEDKLLALRDITKSNPSRVDILPADLNSIRPEDFFINYIQQFQDRIDILVNNAGLLVSKPFHELDDSDFDKLFNTNVKAPAKLIRALLGKFSNDAHIVNISSMGGFQGSVKFPGLSYYSASKGSLAVLTECLAEEFKETGPKFNCLAIGSAQTEMLEKAFPGYEAPVTAEQMASFIADFALTGHKFFNGKVLPVAVSTP
jgi:short-subunit dehydrogenase